MIDLSTCNVRGLPGRERDYLQRLHEVSALHAAANDVKERYYDGKISLGEVNIGIAIPKSMRGLEVGCSWGAKAVDVLAARSMFDGFVGMDGGDLGQLTELVKGNRLVAEYMKACRDELKFGCTFATLSADRALGCKIRFHSPKTSAAKWDGEKGRIAYGCAVIDFAPGSIDGWTPSVINLYTDDAIWVLRRDARASDWTAERHPHGMGRPLMEPMVWNATSCKPFGQSRLKEPVRRLIQGYVRTIANAAIALEFSTAPQKFILGVTDDQYDQVTESKFNAYVGSLFAATTNPENGEKPTFGQLPQGSLSPHVEMLRILATQFSAATGLSAADTGVVNDANPSSSDAILAQTNYLVGLAEQLNGGNGDALRNIALMAMSIAGRTTPDRLSDEQKSVVAHFKNPAMPSIAATADAAIKIASARREFASTDVFLEMIGLSHADIRRTKSQEQRARGARLLEEIGGQVQQGQAEAGNPENSGTAS